MTDISKHPLLRQIHELCQAIEACGASPELTKAVTLATDLLKPVELLVDAKEACVGMSTNTMTVLSDGSAVSIGSFPLPQDHWLYAPYSASRHDTHGDLTDAPHPILTHVLKDEVVAAVRYAIRGATIRGAMSDFDPDALVQNTVVALCGYYGQAVNVTSKE